MHTMHTLITACGPFEKKPLAVCNVALGYHTFSKTDGAIDLLVAEEDYSRLAYSHTTVYSRARDSGLKVENGTLWRTCWGYSYEHLCVDAREEKRYLVISDEKLFILSALSFILHNDPKSKIAAFELALSIQIKNGLGNWGEVPVEVLKPELLDGSDQGG